MKMFTHSADWRISGLHVTLIFEGLAVVDGPRLPLARAGARNSKVRVSHLKYMSRSLV